MEFKDRFLQLRKEKGIGQVKLAKDLGVSNAVISFWETGRNEPTLYMLKKIAEYFKVTTDYLVGTEPSEYNFHYEHDNTKLIHTEKKK